MGDVKNDRGRKLFSPEKELTEKVKKINRRKFVVQRHEASILHYDFRIEINGVLKSWAIPSGPSMNPHDRRLAIALDDQPLSYLNYSGRFKNEKIDVWDKGVFIPYSIGLVNVSDREVMRQLKEGRLRFSVKGQKLKGVFNLIHIDKSKWVLIKGNDIFAVDHEYDSESFSALKSA
jgi:bifunctional non-homologous end joining protein LigD